MTTFPKILLRALLLVMCAAAVGIAYSVVSSNGRSPFHELPKTVSPWKHLSLDEALALKAQGVTFVDSRDKDEYLAGHITGAVNLPVYSFEDHWQEFTQKVAPDAELVVYCPGGECEQSHSLAKRLQDELRFPREKIFILEAGFYGWRDKGLPTSKGEE